MQTRINFFAALYAEIGCGSYGEQRVSELKRSKRKNKDQVIEGDILTMEEGNSIHGFRVVATPGHAPDHIALFDPEQGLLLGGDHLIQHISSNALIEPDQQGQKISSLVQYEQSLKKCQAYPLSVVYPGHGDIVQDPSVLIETRLKGIQRKSEKIKRVFQGEAYTAFQIAQIYYKQKYEQEFSLVMSEVIGHLDRLESLHKVTKERKGNILYYQSV